jgi:hypothetical protein
VKKRVNNFGLALIGGAAVFGAGMTVNLALLGHDRATLVPLLIANSIAGLIAIVIALALQLRHEELHFRAAAEKAATMAELNHNVRNAVFPLFLAVQRFSDPECNRLASESMARLEIALRDAAVDAYSGKIRYGVEKAGRAAA